MIITFILRYPYGLVLEKKHLFIETLILYTALFDEPTWAGYKVFDAYNPLAREIFWNHLKRGLYDQGVDGWWMDATEPSFRDGFTQLKQAEKTKSPWKYVYPVHFIGI